jgi:hypothetical protein
MLKHEFYKLFKNKTFIIVTILTIALRVYLTKTVMCVAITLFVFSIFWVIESIIFAIANGVGSVNVGRGI